MKKQNKNRFIVIVLPKKSMTIKSVKKVLPLSSCLLIEPMRTNFLIKFSALIGSLCKCACIYSIDLRALVKRKLSAVTQYGLLYGSNLREIHPYDMQISLGKLHSNHELLFECNVFLFRDLAIEKKGKGFF